jgi:hypothetical protein
MSQAKTSNHAKAPQAAAFVNAMREVFGEVTVLYVNENGFKLGEKQPDGAPCFTTNVLSERDTGKRGFPEATLKPQSGESKRRQDIRTRKKSGKR